MKAERGGGPQRAAGAVGRSGCLAGETAGATRPTGSTHAPLSIADFLRLLHFDEAARSDALR